MKHTFLIIASIFSFSTTGSVVEHQERISEIEAQIEQKQAEIDVLEAELNELLQVEQGDFLNIGESVSIDGITITIDGVSFVEERNQFVLEMPDQVLLINYTITNNTDGDYPLTSPFKVYVDGEEAKTYPNDNTFGLVEANETIQGTAHYAINGDDIIVQWSPLFHFGTELAYWFIDID